MIKRIFDISFSSFGLLFFSPLMLLALFLVWLQDFNSPFYIAPRVGKNNKLFKMVKIRTMIKNADKSGVDTTSSDDVRITAIGKLIRKIKLDELIQLYNVLIGDMSLVGPRPQVERDVKIYTDVERDLLQIRPGITDFSSIVFSDEGEIVSGHEDPDLCYNQLIRPWKSRLGIFYINNHSLIIDIKIILLTILSIFSKNRSCKIISKILVRMGADKNVIDVVKRDKELIPIPPPGSDSVVMTRQQ